MPPPDSARTLSTDVAWAEIRLFMANTAAWPLIRPVGTAVLQLHLGPSWLEEFDRVTGEIFQQDLASTWAFDDVVPEGQAGGSEPGHFGIDVGDQEVDPVPPAWPGNTPVRHWTAGRACRS